MWKGTGEFDLDLGLLDVIERRGLWRVGKVHGRGCAKDGGVDALVRRDEAAVEGQDRQERRESEGGFLRETGGSWLEAPVDEAGGALCRRGIGWQARARPTRLPGPRRGSLPRVVAEKSSHLSGRQWATAAKGKHCKQGRVRLSWDRPRRVPSEPSRARTSPALASDEALKKIQVKQTKWKVMKVADDRSGETGLPATALRSPNAVDRQRDSVEQAPDKERPDDAVPQAAEYKGHKRGIAVAAERVFALVLRQTLLDVVAQPERKAHVPAAPELADVGGKVGPAEIFGQLQAEQQANAERDVRVPGEVEEELERVAVHGGESFEAGVKGGRVEDARDEVFREVVGDEELFDQADADQ